jgi:hypothetical protein
MRVIIHGSDEKEVEKLAMHIINYATERHSGIAVGKSHRLSKQHYWKQVVISEKISQVDTENKESTQSNSMRNDFAKEAK